MCRRKAGERENESGRGTQSLFSSSTACLLFFFFLNYFLLVAFPLSCSEQYRLN